MTRPKGSHNINHSKKLAYAEAKAAEAGKLQAQAEAQRRKPLLDLNAGSLREHIGKIIDKLDVDAIIDLGRVAAVVAPFVLAERKTGGQGINGLLTGLLAERLIKDNINLPQVTVLGNTVQINAGYAMLAPVVTFLGLNAVGFYDVVIDFFTSAGIAGQGALDALKFQEQSYKEWQAIQKDPTATAEQKTKAAEDYYASKVYRK